MPQNLQVDVHTHIHHFVVPTMTAIPPVSSSISSSTTVPTELQELVALVGRLSTASTETMRLAIEVETRLSVLLATAATPAAAAIITPAAAAATSAVTSAAAATPASAPSATAQPPAAVSATANPNSEPIVDDDPAGPLFVRGIPKTPAELERDHPPGSGETWYVVILGREPGMYATALEADHQCNGVPHQFKVKKTSRQDAFDLYRSLYNGPEGKGVEKWTEVEGV
ncbi:hypothetical protein R3P38DRAFT_3164360 [Favolaschia claudopus]|uniref:Uncharacterized protein n=1 Tax=Favolaschia claudopus TaxID=2862362 RepID=A0AAW0EEL5_9AGAR